MNNAPSRRISENTWLRVMRWQLGDLINHLSIRGARIASGLAAIVLLAVGHWSFHTCAGGQTNGDWFTPLMQAVQLFVLNVPASDIAKCGPAAKTAALLAPFATITVIALITFVPALGRHWKRVQLPSWNADEIFIGADNQARAILAQLVANSSQDKRRRVVLLDTQEKPSAVRWALTHRDRMELRYLACDGENERQLERCGVANPHSRIWILADSDDRNTDILLSVMKIRRAASDEDSSAIIVSVRDSERLQSIRQLWAASLAKLPQVYWLELPKLAVLKLLRAHPPLPTVAIKQSRGLNLCVIGSSEWALSLIVLISHHCVIDVDESLIPQVTFIARNADEALKMLIAQHPLLDESQFSRAGSPWRTPFIRLHSVRADPATLQPTDWEAARGPGFDGIYILEESNIAARSAVRRVLALCDSDNSALDANIPPPIVVATNDHTAKDPGDEGAWPKCVSVFDVYRHCFQDLPHPYHDLDRWADRIHQAYCAVASTHPTPLHELHDSLKWSSRYSALHQEYMRTAVFEARSRAQAEPFESESLARIERRRYVAERLIWNWLPVGAERHGRNAPSGLSAEEQKTELKLNQTLIPTNQLASAEFAKDHAIVHATNASDHQSIEKPAK